MTDKTVNLILKWGQVDTQKVEQGSKGIAKALQEVQRQANATREKMERLTGLGVKLAATGGMIVAPLAMAARSYVQYVGQAEGVSQRWLASSQSLQQSQLRVGRVVAEQVVPYMEMAADLAEGLARQAEKHPGVIGKMLGLGAGMLASGTLTTLVAQGIKLVADVKFLAAAALMKKASSEMLAAAGGMNTASKLGAGAAGAAGATGVAAIAATVVSVLAGAGIGVAINNALANTEVGAQFGSRHIGTYLSTAAYGAGKLFDEETANKWFIAMAEMTGVMDDASISALKAAAGIEDVSSELDGVGVISSQMVDAYIAYQREEKAALEQFESERGRIVEQYEEERTRIQEQYAKDRVAIEEQYEAERSRIAKDYAKQLVQIEQQYQDAQTQATADYQQAEAQAAADFQEQQAQIQSDLRQTLINLAQDYQEQLEDLEREHRRRMEDAAASRDALALSEEQRRYQEEKAELRDEYQQQVQEAKQNAARMMAELRAQYEAEKAERARQYQERMQELQTQYEQQRQAALEAYQQAMDDLNERHKAELEAIKKRHDEELKMLDKAKVDALKSLRDQYEREKKMRYDAFSQQLQQLGAYLGDQTNQWNTFYEQQRAALADFIADMQAQAATGSSSSSSGYAVGGYTSYGRYMLGEQGPEFVMTNASTQAAEHALGGRLSQDRLLSALRSGRGSSRSSIQTINVTIPLGAGSMSLRERRKLVRDARSSALDGLADALAGW